jgi:acyl dehydratase
MRNEVLSFEKVTVGDEIPRLTKRISIVQNVMYSAATWDFHRVHYDREFAQKMGFKEPFADGQIFGAFLAEMLCNWIAPTGTLKRLRLSYRIMASPGDVLVCGGRVIQKYEQNGECLVACELWIENQREERIVPDASAIFSLPETKNPSFE